jgi:hypothetical protein
MISVVRREDTHEYIAGVREKRNKSWSDVVMRNKRTNRITEENPDRGIGLSRGYLDKSAVAPAVGRKKQIAALCTNGDPISHSVGRNS